MAIGHDVHQIVGGQSDQGHHADAGLPKADLVQGLPWVLGANGADIFLFRFRLEVDIGSIKAMADGTDGLVDGGTAPWVARAALLERSI